MDIQPLIDTVFTKNLKDANNKNNLFRIIVIIVLVCFIVTYLFPQNQMYMIILILFALWIANYYIIYNKKDVTNRNNVIMYHLNTLQEMTNVYIDKKLKGKYDKLSKNEIDRIYNNNKLDSLYIDSNMIEFLFSIKKLADWSPSEFYLLLKGTNNILKIRNEIEEYYNANKEFPENIYQMFEQTLILRTNTINNMHRFIFNVPKTHMLFDYVDKIVERYMVLISRNTDKIYQYVQCHIKNIGINTDTKFITYNTIKPYDKNNLDFYT